MVPPVKHPGSPCSCPRRRVVTLLMFFFKNWLYNYFLLFVFFVIFLMNISKMFVKKLEIQSENCFYLHVINLPSEHIHDDIVDEIKKHDLLNDHKHFHISFITDHVKT